MTRDELNTAFKGAEFESAEWRNGPYYACNTNKCPGRKSRQGKIVYRVTPKSGGRAEVILYTKNTERCSWIPALREIFNTRNLSALGWEWKAVSGENNEGIAKDVLTQDVVTSLRELYDSVDQDLRMKGQRINEGV